MPKDNNSKKGEEKCLVLSTSLLVIQMGTLKIRFGGVNHIEGFCM